jgi:natural product precursor
MKKINLKRSAIEEISTSELNHLVGGADVLTAFKLTDGCCDRMTSGTGCTTLSGMVTDSSYSEYNVVSVNNQDQVAKLTDGCCDRLTSGSGSCTSMSGM